MMIPAPVHYDRFASYIVGPFSKEGGAFSGVTGSAPASGTYAATNRIYYYRVVVPVAVTVYQFVWLNGATVGTNNLQMGLYLDDGTGKPGSRLINGSSILSGSGSAANQLQFDNITDAVIGAGVYWVAIWCNGTTATVFRRTTNVLAPAADMYVETAAGGMPASATPVTANALNLIACCGFTTRSGL